MLPNLHVPSAALHELHSGIPEQQLTFWNSMSCERLFAQYNVTSVSVRKLLDLLEEPEFSNASQRWVDVFQEVHW